MTHVDTLRRYLQPSPTLRWHPWAPLLAGFLVIAFVFVLGAQWGHSAAIRQQLMRDQSSHAFIVAMEHTTRFPARDAMRKAGVIDASIARYLRQSREEPGAFQRMRAEAERWLFEAGRKPLVMPRSSMIQLAEFRLRELSGSAPRWQVTAGYCSEASQTLSGLDLRDFAAAEAYSTLLGRKISPEQLAPAVPNARCEPSRRMQ